MLLSNNSRIPVSFECTKLIEELKDIISEFGPGEQLAVWVRKYPQYDNAEVLVNYDFIVEENPITKEEFLPNERMVIMSAARLLDLLKKQNEPVEAFKEEF